MMFQELKIWLVDATGLSRDALHVYVAIALFLCVRVLWRGWRGSLVALLVVATAAATGEWLDHQMELLRGSACSRAEHWHDLRNTMFWPIMIALALPLLRPGRGRPETTERAEDPVLGLGEHAERSFEQA